MIVKNILKYLKGTKNVFMVYGAHEIKGHDYFDSSFQLDINYSKSQSIYVFTLNDDAVSWKSYKQETTSDFIIEAEYIYAFDTVKKASWIKKFITILGVAPKIVDLVALYYDNNRVIAQAKEPRSHQISKHVLRSFHLIKEIIERKEIKIEWVPTKEHLLDPLTMALSQHL